MLPILKNSWPIFMDEFFGNNVPGIIFNERTGITTPAVNITEGENDFRVELAAPGLEKNDFKIDLINNVLTISSERETKKEEKNDKYMRKEFSYSGFCRSFSLPDSVDGEKIEASHKDGILYITIPKREEAKVKPPRNIAIA